MPRLSEDEDTALARSRSPTCRVDRGQQLAGEKEALGFYMSGHPLERFARDLTLFGARRVAEVARIEADIWMAGICLGPASAPKTRKGDRMAVFMLDDVDGSVEVVVFPETFGKHGSLIEVERAMLLVRGEAPKTTSPRDWWPPSFCRSQR